MTRPLAVLVLAILALAIPLLVAARAEAAPRAAPVPAGDAHDDDALPNAAPRGTEAKANPALPPYMGIFGPQELIEKVGFRSVVGRYVEYKLTTKTSGGAKVASMRLQEVGPAVRGARWIEMIATPDGVGPAGMRMLGRGEKNGNLERIIARAPDFPPLEFPIDAVTIDSMPGFVPGPDATTGETMMGTLKLAGKETITVPLGKFETSHWVLANEKQKFEFWTTTDPRIPFTGAVKIETADGTAEAVKVGTDAQAVVPVPGKAK